MVESGGRGNFSIKSCYKKLESLFVREENWSGDVNRVFECIWKNPAPSKVVAFS